MVEAQLRREWDGKQDKHMLPTLDEFKASRHLFTIDPFGDNVQIDGLFQVKGIYVGGNKVKGMYLIQQYQRN